MQHCQHPCRKTHRSRNHQPPAKSVGLPVRKGSFQRLARSSLQSWCQGNSHQRLGRLFRLRAVLWSDRSRQNIHDDRSTIRLQIQRHSSESPLFSLSINQLTLRTQYQSVHFLSVTLQRNADRLTWLKQSWPAHHSIKLKGLCTG